MEAIKIEAIKTNTIIDRKILVRRESIDILSLAAIIYDLFFSRIRLYILNPSIIIIEKRKIPTTP
jgi:hypothetical protein